jgi:hypothetical protein
LPQRVWTLHRGEHAAAIDLKALPRIGQSAYLPPPPRSELARRQVHDEPDLSTTVRLLEESGQKRTMIWVFRCEIPRNGRWGGGGRGAPGRGILILSRSAAPGPSKEAEIVFNELMCSNTPARP